MIRITFLLLILGSVCFAQDSTRFDKLIPRHALKFAPLTLANFYPTIELSYELKVARRITAQVGYGYALARIDKSFDPKFQDKRGYKVKFEIRYYVLPSTRYNLSYYVSPGVYYNNIRFDRETSQQECYDLSCTNTFTRYYNYVVKYQERGFTLKFGFVKHFSKSIFMDVNGGWSFRFIDYDKPAIPPGINNFFGDDNILLFENIPKEEDWFTLTPIIGFRVGYRFK